MPITIYRSHDRRPFDYEWLKTYHTFSFGEYEDLKNKGFRALRAINENYVKPAVGFPLHTNKDMEILSIVLEGGLAHQDDMGNGSILSPGYIQLLSTGRGVTHAEYNASDKQPVHFLQIWINPNTKNLEPYYQDGFFPDSAKTNQWCLILSQEGSNRSLTIHQDVKAYLANLDQGNQLTREIAPERFGWFQILSGIVELNSERVETGDGVAISQITHLDIMAQAPSQLLFFDLS
jgi:redox-sensitive bicupin YhaK (pirin superfamily)